MIRSELLQALSADNPDLRPEEVEQVVDIFFDEIAAAPRRRRDASSCAASGRSRHACAMPAPGATRAREIRSTCPSKRVPYFKPGKEMRERLNTV
jgi:integration host factor subunit beta